MTKNKLSHSSALPQVSMLPSISFLTPEAWTQAPGDKNLVSKAILHATSEAQTWLVVLKLVHAGQVVIVAFVGKILAIQAKG